MNIEPKISVIVPVYKVEKYLDRCVESIVNQTYKNLEIILVDDGSPDNCPVMCDEWAEKDERIRVIHKENGGVSSARNAALEVATGDYIGFVDSDDWISMDMYEYLLLLSLNNDAQISQISNTSVNENDSFEFPCVIEKLKCYYGEEIQFIMMGTGLWDKLYKKELFYGMPCLPNLTHKEDVLLNFLLACKADKMVTSTCVKYAYFRHFDSAVSGCITYNLIDDAITAYDLIGEYINEDSAGYPCYVFHRIMSDFFSLNSIIRNNICLDRYEILRQDILKYKRFVFDIRNKDIYKPRHIFGVFLLMICPKIYDKTIIVRKSIRGY